MMTKRTMAVLVAVPLAGLLAGGGVAAAQAAGAPSGARVVQQAVTHHAGHPDHGHQATAGTQVQRPAAARHDRDCVGCGSGHQKQAQTAATGTAAVAHTHHGDSCDHHGDSSDR